MPDSVIGGVCAMRCLLCARADRRPRPGTASGCRHRPGKPGSRMSLALYKPSCQARRMEAFDVLADPVRRRVLELLATGERTAGEVAAVVTQEFGLTQPAASRHLRVLREN